MEEKIKKVRELLEKIADSEYCIKSGCVDDEDLTSAQCRKCLEDTAKQALEALN